MRSRIQGVVVARRLVILLAGLFAVSRVLSADDTLGPEPAPRWIVVRLSATLFEPLIEQPVDKTLPVDDVILGTHVVGQAHVQGQPQLVLVEDRSSAALTVSLAGTIRSRTVGRKGPVTIFGGSETQFTASKRVVFDPARGFVGEPAKIDINTNVSTERIEARRSGPLGRAIERLAWSQVAASKDEVNAIVREKTERQIRAEFDRLLEERLARVNRAASLRHVVELVLGNSGDVQYACSTSQHGMQIAAAAVQTERAAWSSDLNLPAPADDALPVQVWVHDSVVHRGMSLALDWLEVGRRLCRMTGPLHLTAARDESDARRLAVNLAASGPWVVVELGKQPASPPLRTANR